MKLETENCKLEIYLWVGEVVSLRLTPYALGLGPSTSRSVHGHGTRHY